MRSVLLAFPCLLAACSGGGATRSSNESAAPFDPVTLGLRAEDTVGVDSGRGNVVGIQPWLGPEDYADAPALRSKLDGYLREAKARGWLGDKTVVVFPEYIGLWLAAADEPAGVASAPSSTEAMKVVARHHWTDVPGKVFTEWVRGTREPVRAGLLKLKSRAMADAYASTFSELARTYHATIVAGSIPLPGPTVDGAGALEVDLSQPLYNASFLFHPDGALDRAVVRKVYPTSAENGFVGAGRASDLPIFDTPVGRLGVLVCADSWYPATYAALSDKGGVDVLVVPSYGEGSEIMSVPWTGYDGAPKPPDIDDATYAAEVGHITEREAWLRHAMAGRLASSGARVGLTVFNRSVMWEIGSDGAPIVARAGEPPTIEQRYPLGASMVNVWIP